MWIWVPPNFENLEMCYPAGCLRCIVTSLPSEVGFGQGGGGDKLECSRDLGTNKKALHLA